MQTKTLVGLCLTAMIAACGTKADDPAATTSPTGSPTGDEDDESDDGDEDESGESGDSNSTDPTGEETDPTADSGEETDPTADSGEETDPTVGFIQDPDGGGVSIECDLWAQDCPDGEKCMPWSNDGSSAWNAARCSPLDPNPAQVGDECAVEGSGVSGIDNCDIGTMCWDVDGETNMGTCVSFCMGSEANPICSDPATNCVIANEGVLILCLPNCDPLLQDCAEGQGCYPIDDSFACAPDASGEMGLYGEACAFINVCDPGLFCANPEVVPGCASEGCCSEICDLSDPGATAACSGNAGGQECTPAFEEGQAPPGYENVGYCAIPA